MEISLERKAYSEKANKRLAHVKSHIEECESDIQREIFNIENNLGNPRSCVMSLSSNAEANAMFAWFGKRDLDAMRQWCYVGAKLDQLYYKMQEGDPEWGRGFPQLLKPILSNSKELINWFSHYDLAYDMKRVEDHKTHDFLAYQAIVALRGEWPRLIERCEKIINDPPSASREQRYLIDHDFYLALAKGDMEKMQSVLQELASAKMIRARSNEESGFTADMISTTAVIYAKIAWVYGYQIKIDSPYIPTEWLSTEPLNQYDNYYRFLE